MTGDVTRDEFYEAVRRLDAADAELRAAQESLEVRLRTEFEGKIADAVRSVSGAVTATHDSLHEDVEEVKDHLTWQDRAVAGAVLSLLVYLALHLGFHVM